MKNTIKVETPVFDTLTLKGQIIRKLLDKHQVLAINIMASPGAGKTSLILKLIESLKNKFRIAVIEGDIVPIDVEKIQKQQIPVVLAHTGGACHLDSVMMEKALKKLKLNELDLLLVENVGNLICPASFYLGTHKNIVIASVPEGDDKPYKYPTMFKGADLVVLNKIDHLEHDNFDLQNFIAGVSALDPKIEIIKVSARNGLGIAEIVDWIKLQSKNNGK